MKMKFLLLVLFNWLFLSSYDFSQTIRIMPMGNSITFDDNMEDDTNPRPIGDRISYRFHLYELMSEAGYTFDYAGSENGGINYFLNPEMDDNAGFPGIRDDQLATLISTGYNPMQMVYETPVPDVNYLQYFPADIILLHIGTNSVSPSPDDVENILNNIRAYNPNVFILVARIINRKTYSPTTTTFNNNVQAMVLARNDSRIISVDMENGAGINYTTDMEDYLHPNALGYNKMAAKWFEAIESLNCHPVISDFDSQKTNKGTSFKNIFLDTCVTDIEDSPDLLTWTYKKPNDSHLSLTIDNEHILHVQPINANWFGSEIIKLYAEDSGSGTFKKKDSIDVNFIVADAVGIDEQETIISKVYPNPAITTTQFIFNEYVKDGILNIFSIDGNLFKTIQIINSNSYTLDITPFKNQMIFYQLIFNNKQERGKILIIN